ncbi:MAG: sporulation transcription factor Spo0A [Christensenellaceae bacterium]|nr:sporulation transcription factor Spo0A [Christensenellaceae bacterium]
MKNGSMYSMIIVEGNKTMQEELTEYFNETGEFEVVAVAGDGLEALERIERLQPKVVVFDIVLGSIDGFELLERVQKMSVKPKMIALSSLSQEGFAAKALSLGASYYMMKPVKNEVLHKRIKEFCDEDSSISSTTLIKLKVRTLDEKLSNIFITVGIPAHIKGYQFLREAIKMAIDNPEIINSITKQLYPSIAGRFETSASKVERAIRHAIEVAWNRGKIENINNLFGIKVYNSNEKPTNGEFIALVADKMLIEGFGH